jgi:hypothetical protein
MNSARGFQICPSLHTSCIQPFLTIKYMPYVATADTITPPTRCDEVKKVINGVKNNEALSTDLLYSESFEYGGNEIKKLKI